ELCDEAAGKRWRIEREKTYPDCGNSLHGSEPPHGIGGAIFSDQDPSGTSSIGGIDGQQDGDSAEHKHGTSSGCDPRNPSAKLRVEVYERLIGISGRH